MSQAAAIIGISDHNGWAVFVTAATDGTLLDRRRVVLVDADLLAMPHHHEGQMLPIDEAVELVARVRASAERHASLALDAVAAVSSAIRGVAMRRCPKLPPTTAERIRDYRAQTVADTVMYRMALAGAAESRGWPVHWYDAKTVLQAAEGALRVESIDAYFVRVRQSVGPPWGKDHRLAMSAAIVAAAGG